MKIGVVSDTHSRPIPKQLLKDFQTVDLIIHAGDFCSMEDLNVFTQIKEVQGVFGNMDDSEIRQKFPETQIIECAGKRIGLFHGEGPAKKVLDFVKAKFQEEDLNVIIFGHSHHPMNEVIDGVLYFNPGSPNDAIVAPYCSYGIIEIDDDKVSGSIIKVKDGL